MQADSYIVNVSVFIYAKPDSVSLLVVWGFDEQTVKVLTNMQKQQGFVPCESDDGNVENITKYQVLVSSGVYGQKPAVVEHQVIQPAVANQEVYSYVYVSVTI